MMAQVERPCGAVTIIGALPLGPRPPTDAEREDHLFGCRPCNLMAAQPKGGANHE